MARIKYIKRTIEKKIKAYLKQFPSVILTGPRQSGKSTTLKKILSPKYKYITLENPSLRENISDDPKLFLDEQPDYIIFDEIQYFPELLVHLKMIIDKDRGKRGIFILTGSQQFALMKDVTETLAGRVGILHLLPLSFGEINEKNTPLNRFVNACLRSSFPEMVTHKKYDVRAWYEAYVQTYLERDIKSIYNVGNLRDFHRFMRLLAARCSQLLNMRDIAQDLGVAVNTVKKWISLLEASYNLYLLPPYYRNIGKRIVKSPKIYFSDVGLLCHLLGIRRREDLINHPLVGFIFENYCIQETVKCFENKGLRPEIYYVRTKEGKEIDLIIETAGGFIPVEFKFTKSLTKRMTASMEYYYGSIQKLNLEKGFLVSLFDENIPFSKKITACGVNYYLRYLEKNLR